MSEQLQINTPTEAERAMKTITIDVDAEDLEAARAIMDRLTEPDVPRPLTDEQVAYTLYLFGANNYFEAYGDEEGEDGS